MLLGLYEPLFAQENIIKDFAEERRERKFCLYPSTLRMINLSNNDDYNEMIKELDKLLIYQLDSSTSASGEYRDLIGYYEQEDFEEYITMYGGENSFFIYGKEGRRNQMVGVMAAREGTFAFYLKGNIAWQKIPTLMNSLTENDVLNILDLKIN